MEIAGVVDALGPGAPVPRRGTRVAAVPGQGGLADYVCVAADRCVPLPADDDRCRRPPAFQIAYGTSHLALAHRAGLQPGETLLVLGAAGGVGLTAVEVGARMGARVIASARGADRLAIARAAGAHAPDRQRRARPARRSSRRLAASMSSMMPSAAPPSWRPCAPPAPKAA